MEVIHRCLKCKALIRSPSGSSKAEKPCPICGGDCILEADLPEPPEIQGKARKRKKPRPVAATADDANEAIRKHPVLVLSVVAALCFMCCCTVFNPSSIRNRAAFERIQTGMSYKQVATIVGDEGRLVSSTSALGHTMDVYSWGDMTVIFENGGVMNKSRFALW